MRRAGFTMLELMFAMVLFAILTVVCFFCFNTVVRTWESSTEYADRMQHADYALTQVISGLRSAYYPTTGTQNSKNKDEYGFALKDGGESASGALLAALGGKAEAVRQLAYRLYTLCERLGQAEDARAYNELITSWTGIETAASAVVPPPADAMLPGFE
mgnify:CR=1 FL=1